MAHSQLLILRFNTVMIFQFWGATNEEIHSSVVGDSLCADATLIATRSITIKAPPQDVFPWIRQMGFGRAGWYSYDWLDNLGRFLKNSSSAQEMVSCSVANCSLSTSTPRSLLRVGDNLDTDE